MIPQWYPLANKPGIPEQVDSSKVSDSLQCLQYFYYRHEAGLVPTTPSLSLIYGSAIHAALASFYLGGSLKDMFKSFDQVWTAESKGFEDAKRNPKRAMAMLTAYADRYKNENFQVLLVEEPFMVPLGHIIWMGIIDLLIQLGPELAVIDHKTASLMNSYYWLQYDAGASHQELGYLGAVSKLVQPTRIFAANVLLVSEKQIGFERRFYTRQHSEISTWQSSITAWWQIVQNCRVAHYWPKNPNFCNRWGKCQYHELCSLGGEVITSNYTISHWDPVKELKSRCERKFTVEMKDIIAEWDF